MPWKMQYRFDVKNALAGPGGGALLQAINAAYDLELSLNQAVSGGMAFVRRFQAVGIDAEVLIYGKPVGADVAGAMVPLDAAFKGEKLYGNLDTLARGLRQRISQANHVPPTAGGGLDPDTDPDV